MRSLVYWDNPRDSGIVCGSLLVCLLAVRYISLISVVGNLSLALVTATMSFRIYKSVLAAVNKTQEGHPFKVRPIQSCYFSILLMHVTNFPGTHFWPTALHCTALHRPASLALPLNSD